MTAHVVLQSLASGLLIGFIYALIAVGVTIIFGLMELVNFAHGEFMMLSMFIAYWMYALLGVDPLFSLPVCAVVMFGVGVLAYLAIIKNVLSAPMLAQVFATFGLGLLIRSSAQYLWTPDFRLVQRPLLAGRISLGGIFIGRPELVASLVAVLCFAGLYWFISRTEMGRALQAVSEDREAAALMGIDSHRVFALGWGIGGACVGIAGALMANFFYIFPEVGFTFSLIAYVVVAMGGFGSVMGAFVSGALVGLVEILGGLLVGPAWKYAIVFALYLVVVFVRPQGLFGRF